MDLIHRSIPVSALPPLSRAAFRVAQVILEWETRRKTRSDLRRLDGHMLRDIGLDADLASQEAAKPFWRP